MKSFQGCKIWGDIYFIFYQKNQQQLKVLSHIYTIFSTDIFRKILNDN